MAEVVKGRNLVTGTVLPAVEIVAELICCLEIDQFQSVFRANRIDYAEYVFLFLGLPSFVAGAIDQPSNLRRWPILISQLLDPETAGADKVEPPVVMRLKLVFLPGHKGDSTGGYDVLASVLAECERRQGDRHQNRDSCPVSEHGEGISSASQNFPVFRKAGRERVPTGEESPPAPDEIGPELPDGEYAQHWPVPPGAHRGFG